MGERLTPSGQILVFIGLISLLLIFLLNSSPHLPQLTGNALAYIVPKSLGEADIYAKNLTSGSTFRLTTTRIQKCCISWSPDGGQIAFSSQIVYKGMPTFQNYLVDMNSGEIEILIASERENYWPIWSPDGHTIAFLSRNLLTEKLPYLYLVDKSGANLRPLAVSAGEPPSWSPDGKSLVFVSQRENRQNIYTINVDGSHERQLTYNDDREHGPAWSPDGQWIIFTAESHDYTWKTYRLSSNGHTAELMDTSGITPFGLVWSPDGKKLAFFGNPNSNIYTMNADGTDVQQLTTGTGDIYPVWSPDGKWIAYTSIESTGRSEVFVMKADGSDIRQITFEGGSSPVWRP